MKGSAPLLPSPAGLYGLPTQLPAHPILPSALYLDNHSSPGCLKIKMNVELVGVRLAPSPRSQLSKGPYPEIPIALPPHLIPG